MSPGFYDRLDKNDFSVSSKLTAIYGGEF